MSLFVLGAAWCRAEGDAAWDGTSCLSTPGGGMVHLQDAPPAGRQALRCGGFARASEDNAVYLSGEYDQRFGTFTGKESFEGDLEVLNDQGKVLLKTKDQFKGWQR